MLSPRTETFHHLRGSIALPRQSPLPPRSPLLLASLAAMADGPLDPPAAFLHPRRKAFEHGLLPIPKLIFPEGTLAQTLAQLKEKLAPAAVAGRGRVGAAALVQALQIPTEQAALALGTLAAVLPAEDPALGADLRDVLLFLYIQSYKRLVPRAHKDSPAVADVWPSTSAFDGYLSALSPIQQRPLMSDCIALIMRPIGLRIVTIDLK